MAEWGKFLLRLATGSLLLFHGIHKIIYGIGGVKALLVVHSLPALSKLRFFTSRARWRSR